MTKKHTRNLAAKDLKPGLRFRLHGRGRNVYLLRHRMGDETVHRVTRARRRDRVMEVHDLSTGRWLPVMPELGARLEVR